MGGLCKAGVKRQTNRWKWWRRISLPKAYHGQERKKKRPLAWENTGLLDLLEFWPRRQKKTGVPASSARLWFMSSLLLYSQHPIASSVYLSQHYLSLFCLFFLQCLVSYLVPAEFWCYFRRRSVAHCTEVQWLIQKTLHNKTTFLHRGSETISCSSPISHP